MVTVSIVLATFNEEKNIGECLESVKDLADEIIMVDGGSNDKTVQIARQYKANVIETSNPPIFHLNKQKAIETATKDWILQLDADERVTPELSEEIRLAINHKASAINGYYLPRKNWFLGRFLTKGGQYPDYTLRLYKRGKGKLPCQSVHEQAVVDGRVDYFKNPLIHMADINFNRYLIRWNRYTDLMAEEIKQESAVKNTGWRFSSGINFLIIKPIGWFLLTYIRHKGFIDSWQGLVFCLFSALRFPIAYLKYSKIKLISLISLIGLISLMYAGPVIASDYVMPYPSFMPGSSLYRVGIIIDRLQEFYSFGNFSKFKYYLKMSDKKLIEAKTLFEYKQFLLATRALNESDAYFLKISPSLLLAKKEGKNIQEKSLVLKEAQGKHLEILNQLLKVTPENFNWQPENKPSTLLQIHSQIEASIKTREQAT